MIQRVQINVNDGSFESLVKKGSGAKGQINTSSSFFGKKITLVNSITNQSQVCNKQSLIDFLKNTPEGADLKKKGFFKKGSSDLQVQTAYDNYVLRLNPKVTLDKEAEALNQLIQELEKKEEKVDSKKPLDVIIQYVKTLPTVIITGEDESGESITNIVNTNPLPLDIKTTIAILLVVAGREAGIDSRESAMKWIDEQFKSILLHPTDQTDIKNYLLSLFKND